MSSLQNKHHTSQLTTEQVWHKDRLASKRDESNSYDVLIESAHILKRARHHYRVTHQFEVMSTSELAKSMNRRKDTVIIFIQEL